MTYGTVLLVGLIVLTHIPYFFPAPAFGMEAVIREWQRDRDRRVPPPSRIDNPDKGIENQIIDYVWGDSQQEAERNCRQIATQTKTKFNKVRRTSQRGKKWECHVLNNHPEQ